MMMLHDIKDYFYFTRNEKKGIAALSMLILLSIFMPRVYEYFFSERQKTEIELLAQSGVFCFPDEKGSDSLYPYKNKTNHYIPGGKKFTASFIQQGKTLSKQVERVDLNTADSLDLLSLPGIGPYFAVRIIRYRDRLGGFIDINQLFDIKGFDETKMKMIRSRIKAGPCDIKKININTAEFKSLLRHPYFTLQIAKAVIKFRQQYGSVSDLEEIHKSELMPDSVYRKILPYLSLQ